MNETKISDGLVQLWNGSDFEVAPIELLLKNKYSEYEILPGVWECPVGISIFRLVGDGGRVVLRHEILSSGKYYVVPWGWGLTEDYVIVGDRFIPLDSAGVIGQLQSLDEIAVRSYESLNLRDYLAVLRCHANKKFNLILEESAIAAINSLETSVELPEFHFQPYDYQLKGIKWLVSLFESKVGAILADGMGLGKTLQLIGLVESVIARNPNARILIVVPGSLIVNWCEELVKFSNHSLDVQIHHGPNRSNDVEFLRKKKIIVGTYDSVFQDSWLFDQLAFDLVVCDEAHKLKNPHSKKRNVISKIRSMVKVLATGTPFNNHLMDLWSLTDIVSPGLLGSLEDFQALIVNSSEDAELISNSMLPLMLRRSAQEANLNLPEQISYRVMFEFNEQEASEYATIGQGCHPRALGAKGRAAITPKRQFSAHTGALSDENLAYRGAKMEYLIDKIRAIWGAEEKAIVFVAGFTKPIDLIVKALQAECGITNVFQIDGRVQQLDRGAVVRNFNHHHGFAALVMNTDVGGEGLNITSANHVFHMSPAWNPAKINQATFRVSRPGQTRTTFIHELYYSGSIETAMLNLIDTKQEISDAALYAAEVEGSDKKSTLTITEAING